MSKSPDLIEQGRRLREIRAALNITREEFAKRLGLQYVTLKNAENGVQKLGSRTMADAERMATTGLPAVEGHPQAPYPPMDVSDVQCDPTDVREMVRSALDLAAQPDVHAAAKTLARVLGVTERDALGIVIAEKLQRR